MKKKLLTITLTTVTLLSVFLLLMVACKKKEPPKAPTGVRSSVEGSSIRVTWNSVENALYYTVTDEVDIIYEDEVYATSWTDYSPNEGYNRYRVYAVNEYGMNYGSTSCYYSGNATPSAPTGLSAQVMETKVRISWNSVSDAYFYRIYRSSTRSSKSYSLIGTTSSPYFDDHNPLSDNYYKVSSVGSDGSESEMSSSVYCYYSSGGGGGGGSTTLDAPTGVSASVIGSYVHVTWNSVSGASSYRIFRAPSSSGSYSFIGTGGSARQFNDNNPMTDNYYKVTAVGSDDSESEMSSYAYCQYSGGGGGGSAPSAPTGVSAVVSGSQIKVSWNSVSGADEYLVYWSNNGTSYTYLVGSTSSTYLYDSDPYEDNYYKVKAKNSYGESALSSYAYCHYSSGGGTVPSAPTGVSAIVSGSKIKVSWNSVSDADEYIVYWSSNGSNYSSIGSTSSTYIYDNNPSEDNYYKVKAKNSYGESSFSSYAYCHYTSGGGGGSNYEPCPPSVTVTTSTSYATVKWTASTGFGCGTPSQYKVYKRNPHTSNMSLLTTTTSTNYKDNDVHPGINRYAVIAVNSYGESGYQYGNSTSIALAKPSSFTAQKYQSTYIRCNWSKVTKANGYQISLSTSSSGTYVWEQIDNVNTTTKDIYYPANSGTTVYLKIRAIFIAEYAGDPIYSDWTTYKTVTF